LRKPPELFLVLAAFAALFLTACETTWRALPPFERALAKSEFQSVRTTAYTHTESDHREFSNRNALGTELRAAAPAMRRAENMPRAIPVSARQNITVGRVSDSRAPLEPFSLDRPPERAVATGARAARSTYAPPRPVVYGSAAADWSRWPVGTVFRLLSTGQVYRVDDYGWALAGRNTIDLYMANQRDMNVWGARQERIQVLQWGDTQESLRVLQSRQKYRHVRRMVLQLEGREKEAAALR
jgi:3D (Asp-Asp-Asp) domain-containing protein